MSFPLGHVRAVTAPNAVLAALVATGLLVGCRRDGGASSETKGNGSESADARAKTSAELSTPDAAGGREPPRGGNHAGADSAPLPKHRHAAVRILSLEGDAGVVGSEPRELNPLRAPAGSVLVLRESATGLELRLKGPAEVFFDEGSIGLIQGEFEALNSPFGATEFWLTTLYGSMRYDGRIRVSVGEHGLRVEALQGKAFFVSSLDAAWAPIQKPIEVKRAPRLSDQDAIGSCKLRDEQASLLSAQVQLSPNVAPALVERQIEAKKLAHASCEYARLLLRKSTEPMAMERRESIVPLGRL